MADGKVLEFSGVTKVFGDVSAVSELTARIEPGVVTAFLGPNGAGKTTSLRILLGDVRATSGSATIGGTPFSNISRPANTVGAVLESPTFRQRRTATRQLTSVAKANNIPLSRVREVLDLVGLADVADMKIAGFSLGMRQRLAVAQALLGDPGVLIFDEPVNGMDPEGIRWMRLLMRRLADEGRTVLMSSHLLSEVQQIADRILIISNGTLVFSGGIEELADVDPIVAVDSPDRASLTRALREQGYEFEVLRSGVNVRDASARELGRIAAEAGIALSVLHQRGASLEDVFLDLVNGRSTRQTAALPRETTGTSGGGAEPATDAADSAGAVEAADGDAGAGAAGATTAAGAAAVGAAVAGAAVTSRRAARAASATGADSADEQPDEAAEPVDTSDEAATDTAGEATGDDATAVPGEGAAEAAGDAGADDEIALSDDASEESTADDADEGPSSGDADEASDEGQDSEPHAEEQTDDAEESDAPSAGDDAETHDEDGSADEADTDETPSADDAADTDPSVPSLEDAPEVDEADAEAVPDDAETDVTDEPGDAEAPAGDDALDYPVAGETENDELDERDADASGADEDSLAEADAGDEDETDAEHGADAENETTDTDETDAEPQSNASGAVDEDETPTHQLTIPTTGAGTNTVTAETASGSDETTDAPADGAEETPAAGSSPWSRGASFADRVGTASAASASDDRPADRPSPRVPGASFGAAAVSSLPGAASLASVMRDDADSARSGAAEAPSDESAATGSSPWSRGASFADRVGAASTAADDRPEDDPESRHTAADLEDPTYVSLGETEPIGRLDLEDDAAESAGETDGAEGDAGEPDASTQEMNFDSFVASFETEDDEDGTEGSEIR